MLINTKMAKWINSYFIHGASHKHSNYIFVNKSNHFFIKGVSNFKFGYFYFPWPPLTSATSRSDGKPQILFWMLTWKKGKILVYFWVKVSILTIWGPRLIFKIDYLLSTIPYPAVLLLQKLESVNRGRQWSSLFWFRPGSVLSVDCRAINTSKDIKSSINPCCMETLILS